MGFCSDVFFCCRKSRKSNRKKKHVKKKQKYNIYQEENLNELQKVQFTHSFMQGESAKKNDCQDAFAIIDNYPDLFYFFAVLDGHGSSGKEASNAACDSFQQYFENNIQKIQYLENEGETDSFIRSGNFFPKTTAFKLTEKKLKFSGIDYSTSGTCCISIYIQKNKCFISNLGDSRAVMCRITPKERVAVEQSYDHKPTRKDERYQFEKQFNRERIVKYGGKIEKLNINGELVGPYRVWVDEEGPGIAMTRTQGDIAAKKIGLLSTPEIFHIEMRPGDRFIVIASDGVWDVMKSAEVVGYILKHPDRETAADGLVKEARGRWVKYNQQKRWCNNISDYPTARRGIDDITVVIAYMKYKIDNDEYKNLQLNAHGKIVYV